MAKYGAGISAPQVIVSAAGGAYHKARDVQTGVDRVDKPYVVTLGRSVQDEYWEAEHYPMAG